MDSKNIKDYLHLYLGCDTDKGKLIGIELNKAICMMNDLSIVEGNIYNLKPILRPLSDMTEEEEKEMFATQDDVKLEGFPQILLKADSGETFRYMLSKGFDLFDLIDAGLAIKKSS